MALGIAAPPLEEGVLSIPSAGANCFLCNNRTLSMGVPLHSETFMVIGTLKEIPSYWGRMTQVYFLLNVMVGSPRGVVKGILGGLIPFLGGSRRAPSDLSLSPS